MNVRRSGTGLFRLNSLRCQPAFGQFDDVVGRLEITVVMTDHQRRFAARFDIRQDFVIEDLLEFRVLVRRPFVE